MQVQVEEGIVVQSELVKARDEISILANRVTAADERNRTLETLLEDKEKMLLQAIEELKLEKLVAAAAMTDQSERLKSTDDLKATVERLQFELSAAGKSLTDSEAELEATKERLKTTQQQQHSQQEDLGQLFVQLTQQQDQIDKLEEALATAKNEALVANAKCQRLEVSPLISEARRIFNIFLNVCI